MRIGGAGAVEHRRFQAANVAEQTAENTAVSACGGGLQSVPQLAHVVHRGCARGGAGGCQFLRRLADAAMQSRQRFPNALLVANQEQRSAGLEILRGGGQTFRKARLGQFRERFVDLRASAGRRVFELAAGVRQVRREGAEIALHPAFGVGCVAHRVVANAQPTGGFGFPQTILPERPQALHDAFLVGQQRAGGALGAAHPFGKIPRRAAAQQVGAGAQRSRGLPQQSAGIALFSRHPLDAGAGVFDFRQRRTQIPLVPFAGVAPARGRGVARRRAAIRLAASFPRQSFAKRFQLVLQAFELPARFRQRLPLPFLPARQRLLSARQFGEPSPFFVVRLGALPEGWLLRRLVAIALRVQFQVDQFRERTACGAAGIGCAARARHVDVRHTRLRRQEMPQSALLHRHRAVQVAGGQRLGRKRHLLGGRRQLDDERRHLVVCG